MSINSNFNPDQLRAVGTKNPSRFAADIPSAYEIDDLAPNPVSDITEHDASEIEAAEFTVLAARYGKDEAGADPAYWRLQSDIQKLVNAPADRALTNAEQKGWDTVNADLRVFDTQPISQCVTFLTNNLALARNTQAVYRIAGFSEHQPTLDQVWETRAERIALILDGLDSLNRTDAVAA